MSLVKTILLLASALVLVTGCYRAQDLPPSADADTDSDSDSDSDTDGDTDTDTVPDGWAEGDFIGAACTLSANEDDPDPCATISGNGARFCFMLNDASLGICTQTCLPATYEVPVQTGCPSFDGFVCMDVSHLTETELDDDFGTPICVEECVPQPADSPGPCESDLIRCDPDSWSFESQFATCLLPKCEADADCPVLSGPTCEDDGDCLTESGETCDDDGYCVFDGTCNPESGRCTWEAGNPGAEPGDPCQTSWDCEANATCIVETTDEDGKVAPRNGYCARYGCKAANTAASNGSGSADPAVQEEFSCGMLGTCHTGFRPGGLCLKRCLPDHTQIAFSCRQQSWTSTVEDQGGDFDCYDQTAYGYYIATSGNTEFYYVATAPTCAPVGRTTSFGIQAKCGDSDIYNELTPTDCAERYGGFPDGWGLSMTCRDPETGEADLHGYCLDSTTSGPTEGW
jgi:hypothetical protein